MLSENENGFGQRMGYPGRVRIRCHKTENAGDKDPLASGGLPNENAEGRW
jgi:hypothetical protein